MSGLVASYVFKKRFPSIQVVILEPDEVATDFLSRAPKYVRYNSDTVSLFEDLDLLYSEYTIRGGVLLEGRVRKHHKSFSSMSEQRVALINSDFYRKTRKSEGDPQAVRRAMSDAEAVKPRCAIRCYFPDFVSSLATRATIKRASVVGIKAEDNEVIIAGGKKIGYDFLVLTRPLWEIKEVASFYVPSAIAMQLSVANILPMKDVYPQWDYVYTPYTPAGVVHRIVPNGGGYSVEASGNFDRVGFISDLNFLFGDGYSVEGIRTGMNGYLLPLSSKPQWPANVAPLGKYAKWNSKATVDTSMKDAAGLLDRWFR